MNIPYTSRKLIGLLLFFVIATVALFIKILSPELWVDFSKWIFLAYVGGNVASKFAENITVKKQNGNTNGE